MKLTSRQASLVIIIISSLCLIGTVMFIATDATTTNAQTVQSFEQFEHYDAVPISYSASISNDIPIIQDDINRFQDDLIQDDATCYNNLETFYTVASEACIGGADDSFCNGGNAPIVEPAGPVANSLAPVASMVEIGVVDTLQTTALADDGSSGGIAWMRVSEFNLSAVLMGDVSIRNVTLPDFPNWSSMIVQTNPTPPTCSLAPMNSLVLQSRVPGLEIPVVVNGVSLRLNGTAMVITEG